MTTKSDNIVPAGSQTTTITWPDSDKSCLVVNGGGNITAFYNQSGETMFHQDTSNVKSFKIEENGVTPKVTGSRDQDGMTILVYGSNDNWSHKIVATGNRIVVTTYTNFGKRNREYCFVNNIISHVNAYENELCMTVTYIDGKKKVEQHFNSEGVINRVVNYE